MKKIALFAVLAATGLAQAQVTSFKTYRASTVYTPNGKFTPSTPLYEPDSSEFAKFQSVVKPYYALMGNVASQYGYEADCKGVTEDAFLSGNTESAFRASEKLLVKDYTTTTSGYRAPKIIKSIPVRNMGQGITASFYIHQSPQTDLTSRAMYGFFFNSKLKQGVMLACLVFPK